MTKMGSGVVFLAKATLQAKAWIVKQPNNFEWNPGHEEAKAEISPLWSCILQVASQIQM